MKIDDHMRQYVMQAALRIADHEELAQDDLDIVIAGLSFALTLIRRTPEGIAAYQRLVTEMENLPAMRGVFS